MIINKIFLTVSKNMLTMVIIYCIIKNDRMNHPDAF